jgi:hypothetical protein
MIEAELPSGDWSEICDGTLAEIVTSRECIIPMETFWDSATFNLQF